MRPETRYFAGSGWPVLAAALIQDRIADVLSQQTSCSVVLTGGRSAERLYKNWSELPAFLQLSGVNFYFGDERCVPPDHADSNYGLAMRTLFCRGVPIGCSVYRMEADDLDRAAAAQRYGETIPQQVDVMLLSVGEDGHIASLFPGTSELAELSKRVVPVNGPKRPNKRLTITPAVILQAQSIFVLATGASKADVLVRALQNPGDFVTLPARLVLDATWVLDTV